MTLAAHPHRRGRLDLRQLVGSGDTIGLAVLPVLIAGTVFNALFRPTFAMGGPPGWLAILSVVVLAIGVANWAWSAWLILSRVPRGELITDGPFAVVKHPLYTGVAFLVLPWVGILCDTWLGVVAGIAVYMASRRFAPAEERDLARSFGAAWEAYRHAVLIPWL